MTLFHKERVLTVWLEYTTTISLVMLLASLVVASEGITQIGLDGNKTLCLSNFKQ